MLRAALARGLGAAGTGPGAGVEKGVPRLCWGKAGNQETTGEAVAASHRTKPARLLHAGLSPLGRCHREGIARSSHAASAGHNPVCTSGWPGGLHTGAGLGHR